jgi:hypothetical protein
LEDEAYTRRRWPGCGHEHKPRGRNDTCRVCGLRAHRDAVGAANILSVNLNGEMGHIQATEPTYRQPFRKACAEPCRRRRPRRSSLDTGQVAAASGTPVPVKVGISLPLLLVGGVSLHRTVGSVHHRGYRSVIIANGQGRRGNLASARRTAAYTPLLAAQPAGQVWCQVPWSICVPRRASLVATLLTVTLVSVESHKVVPGKV